MRGAMGKRVFLVYAISKDTDQPAHQHTDV